LALEAKDEQVAGQMALIAQGMVALLKLQDEKPEAVKLANALAIAQNGASVSATLSLPNDDILAILKADAARKAAQAKQP